MGRSIKKLPNSTNNDMIEQSNSTDISDMSDQPTLKKSEDANEETLEKANRDIPCKSKAELAAAEMAKRKSWEGKKPKDWKKGDLILDTYKVEDIIKEGGMGCIYIAEHLGWKVKMAIKSPNDMMLSDQNRFSRVLREAEEWIELNLHPHITFCNYVRQIEDIPHIFIEYVDGGNLRGWIADGRCYDLKVGLDIAIQVCHGMEHAHKHGMIHRDIKPENILMTKEGIVKVTDFGAAKGTGFGEKDLKKDRKDKKVKFGIKRKENLTIPGTVIGTYDYMAPEQYKDFHNVDVRADIYSFGVCLYEMFCGRRPFEPASEIPASVLAKMENKWPYEPSSLREDMPPELVQLLKRCCELERDKRYASFIDLRQELIRIYYDLFNEEPPHKEVKAIDLMADGLNNRGVSFLDLEREEDARRCWEGALKIDLQHLEANFNFGYLRWQKAEISDDILVTQMLELENSKGIDPDYWRCLAWIHFERGDIEAVDKIQQSKYRVEDEAFKKALDDKDRPVGRFIRTFEGHTHDVSSVCFSLNGCYVLSGSADKTLRLWNVETGKEISHFKGHTNVVNSICFSPDGCYVLSGSADKTVRLWDIESGREIRRFKEHTNNVASVCFSPDGRYALSGSWDKTVRLWDIESGREIRRFEGHTGFVGSVCFSPNGHFILSGSGDVKSGNIRLWEIKTGREIKQFVGHTGYITSVCFSPDGRYALSGSYDETARLWDIESSREIRRFEGHKLYEHFLCFSPDGRYALSGSSDGMGQKGDIRLWDIESGRETRQFVEQTRCVLSACFSPDNHYALTGDKDKTIKLWEIYYTRKDWKKINPYPLLSKVKAVARLSMEMDKVRTLLKSASDYINKNSFQEAYRLLREGQSVPGYERNKEIHSLLTLCGIKGKGRPIKLKGAWFFCTLDGHTHRVCSITFSPDGCYALSGSQDTTVRLWDVESGREIRRFKGHKWDVFSVCFSHDGRYALSGRCNIRLWDVKTGREIRRFEGHRSYIHSVCFSPDGQYALSGSEDKTVRLWDVESGREIRRFEGHRCYVISVCFSPDGRYILTGLGDDISKTGDIRLWEVKSGREIRRFEGHTSWVISVCFSPDGCYVLSGSADKTLRLWNVESGRETRRFEGHTSWVNSVCFSPDGHYALSGSSDKTLRLWDVESGREIKQFLGHTDGITSVSFSPDGRYALSGSADKTIRLWEFDWEWEF